MFWKIKISWTSTVLGQHFNNFEKYHQVMKALAQYLCMNFLMHYAKASFSEHVLHPHLRMFSYANIYMQQDCLLMHQPSINVLTDDQTCTRQVTTQNYRYIKSNSENCYHANTSWSIGLNFFLLAPSHPQ